MKKKSICGDCFVVPNHATKFGKLFSFTKDHINYWCDQLGLERPSDDTVMVQVWCTNSKSNNWGDHGTPWALEVMQFDEADTTDAKNEFYFTRWFPADIFKGHKEGDTILLSGPEKEVFLDLRQQGYRYETFGPFEDALEAVTKGVAA